MNARLALALTRGAFSANAFRLALTVLCIALGVALAVAVHTIHSSALAEIDRAAHLLSGTADLEIRGPRNGFDDATFLDVAARPEVAVASPVVEVDAPLADREGTLRVTGIDALRAWRLQPAFVAGSANVPGAGALLDEASAWLTPPAAARLDLREGDRLRLIAGNAIVEWKVAGVLQGLGDAGELAIVDIAAAQWRLGRLGVLSRIDLRLRPGIDPGRFGETLAGTLPAGLVVSPPGSISARAAAVSRAYRVNIDALALVALATGAFLVFSTLALQAARRRQEFALLRALGVTRRGLTLLLLFEAAIVGGAGVVAGSAIGVAGSRALLRAYGADLGAGYFGAESTAFAPDLLALAGIAALGIGTAMGGALWVARIVSRIEVAAALRDRAVDLPQGGARRSGRVALGLAAAGIPLLALPPAWGLPLAGYAAIALWLCAAVVAIEPLCRRLVLGPHAVDDAVTALALAQVRHLPGHLTASVAGIVLSASLSVAMVIMVFSFRVSLEDWLGGVVGADLYVRAAQEGDTGYFTSEDEQRIAKLAEVASLEPLRYDRLPTPAGTPLSIVARPIHEKILRGFRTSPPEAIRVPAKGAADAPIEIWISEAARDLHGWQPGGEVVLPLGGRPVKARVVGVVRDYARTWGAVLVDIRDYRRLTGDTRTNDFAIHLAPGIDGSRAAQAIRAAVRDAPRLHVEDAADLRRRSLALFDRSFAVTYALEAIAILIGLAGVTSSFAALAWARRREFGMLRFVGLRRRDILRLLALEGAVTGALGAAIGLVAGIAISLVLIHVVNRQSFHWTLEVHWPVGALVALVASLVALCAFGARASGAYAVRHEAVLAVKDDA